MFQKIPGNVEEDSGKCSRRFWGMFRGMFEKIPGNVRRYSGECLRRLRGIFKEIPENVPEDSRNVSKDSRECWQRFSRMFKKIESKDIYSNIIKNVRKSLSKHHCECKWECVSIIAYFILLRNNQPVRKALTMKL